MFICVQYKHNSYANLADYPVTKSLSNYHVRLNNLSRESQQLPQNVSKFYIVKISLMYRKLRNDICALSSSSPIFIQSYFPSTHSKAHQVSPSIWNLLLNWLKHPVATHVPFSVIFKSEWIMVLKTPPWYVATTPVQSFPAGLQMTWEHKPCFVILRMYSFIQRM